MRTSFAMAVVSSSIAGLAIAGCGGVRTSRSGVVTMGAYEEPITCDVPHAPAMDRFEQATRLQRSGDPGAIDAYLSACDHGNPCACTEAGEAFIDDPDRHDVRRGLALLDRGCEDGDAWGCWAEAAALWRYQPARVDHAAELLEDACEGGNARACGELGRFRISGLGGGVAPSDAIPLYERACQGGEPYYCYLLGQAFALGIGAHADPLRARELLTWSCDEADIAPACTAWATTLEATDPQRAEYLQLGCRGGDPLACDALDAQAADRTGQADTALTCDATAAREVTPGQRMTIDSRLAGTVDLATLGLRPACVGFVHGSSDAVLNVPSGLESITVRAHADADTVLAVRDPSGHWTCIDDPPAGAYHAAITIRSPTPGQWAVWGGAMRATEVPGAIEVTSE